MTLYRYSESPVVLAACRQDFPSFIRVCFHIVNPSTPLLINWHHYGIAHHLELVRRGSIRRLAINCPRRYLKSLITSVAFPAWVLGHDPSKRIVVASYGADLSIKLHNDFRAVVNHPLYRAIFPNMHPSPTKNTELEFATTLNGYRFATTIEGSLAGRGGDILIIDDPLKPGDASFENSRNRVNRWFCDTALPALDDKQHGAVIIVAQRLHEHDLTGYLLGTAPNDLTLLALPAIATSNERIAIGDNQYHVRAPGDLLHPEREPLEALRLLRSQFGDEIFAAQYQQDPQRSGGALIKREWIRYYDRLPEELTSSSYVIWQSWDPGKSGESNAHSVCTTWAFHDKKYYLVDVFVGQLDYSELKHTAISLAHEYKPAAILIEDTVLGTAMIDELERLGLPVVQVTPKGDKKSRMQMHIPKFANGQIQFPREKPGCADVVRQLLDFPGGRLTDIVDSISQALTYEVSECQWNDTNLENFARFNAALGGGFW